MGHARTGPKPADPAKKPRKRHVEKRLSDADVRKAKPGTKPTILPDGGGLIFRVLPSGTKLAEFRFKLKDENGIWRDSSLHLGTYGSPVIDDDGTQRPFGLADARAARDAARKLVAQGRDPREVRRLERLERVEAERKRLAELEGRRAVREAFSAWRELYLEARNADGSFAHRKDGGQFVADLFARHVLPVIGERPLDEVHRPTIADVIDRITARGTRRTANMALSLLRQFLRWCAMRGWLESDPTFGFTQQGAGGKIAPRKRNLSTLEIVELRDKLPGALPERGEHIVWLLLASGVRVGELAGARIADFDLDRAEWRIPATKNGLPHLVHLSDFALVHVRRLIALATEQARKVEVEPQWLLPSSRDQSRPVDPKAITNAIADRQRESARAGRWKAVKRKVGRKPKSPRPVVVVESAQPAPTLRLAQGEWRPHDLRRTMASRMGDIGIRPDVIERCLNHRPQGIVAVYQRAELLPERRAAFDAWGAELAQLQTAKVDNVQEIDTARARKPRAA